MGGMDGLWQEILDSMYRSIYLYGRREQNEFHDKHVAHIIWCKYELAKMMMRDNK